MIRQFSISIIIMLLLTSCQKQHQEKKIVNEILFFRDNNIKLLPDTIFESMKSAIENGSYKLNDEAGFPICEGKFVNGFKVGEWTYHTSVKTLVNVNWKKYEGGLDSVEIIHPENWTILSDPGHPFQATFPLTPNESKEGKYFVILSQYKDSVALDLKGYQEYYKSEIFKTEKVIEYAHFLFETTSGQNFYFLRYILQRGDEKVAVFTFIGEEGPRIYDATYSSLYGNYAEKHIIFFDMIRSLKLGAKRFFSPYDPVKTFTRFEYQEEQQSVL